MKTIHHYVAELRKQLRAEKSRARRLSKVILALTIALAVLLTAVLALVTDKVQTAQEYDQLRKSVLINMSTAEAQSAQPEKPKEITTTAEQDSLVSADLLGEYTITYYCSCEECCDQYGSDRPEVGGREVVFTSTGEFAQEGVTVAVDPDQIPYGTLLYIEGVGYRIAQDCGGAIQGNRIDVYMDSHQSAIERGIHTAQVYTITTGGNNK